MKRHASIVIAIIIAIVSVFAGMLLSRALFQPTASAVHGEGPANALEAGTVLDPPKPLPSFQLIDHTGNPFTNEHLQGRWTFVFFGFTNCPDVCPMTLHTLAQVEQSLADLPESERPRVTLISVDPARDTPEQLAKYVAYFNPSFVGVTGEEGALNEFTREVGVPVVITSTGDGAYTVDHSAAIFLINPQGEIRALFSPPHTPQAIAADYRQLVLGTDARSDG
mgnify:CR=1 FL=1